MPNAAIGHERRLSKILGSYVAFARFAIISDGNGF
jgi:hypothetical protein